MSIGEFLKGLILDSWHKVFVYLGGIFTLLALLIEVKGISNSQLLLLSSGTMLFGLGTWIGQKTETGFKPPNAYTGPAMVIKITKWKPDLLGVALNIAGVILIILGIVSITKT